MISVYGPGFQDPGSEFRVPGSGSRDQGCPRPLPHRLPSRPHPPPHPARPARAPAPVSATASERRGDTSSGLVLKVQGWG